jgi:hypothetical protein
MRSSRAGAGLAYGLPHVELLVMSPDGDLPARE